MTKDIGMWDNEVNIIIGNDIVATVEMVCLDVANKLLKKHNVELRVKDSKVYGVFIDG